MTRFSRRSAPSRRPARFALAVAISVVGDGLRFGAVPLLALRADASAGQIALLFAAGALPWLVFSLVGGAIVDRSDHRRLLIGIDLVRVVLVCGLVLVALADVPSLVALAAALFALGACEVVYTSGLVASLPDVVEHPDHLMRANAQLAAAQDVGQDLIGPAAGAALFAVAAPVPFVVDAVSFLVCAALIATVPFGESGRPNRAHHAEPLREALLRDVRSGLGWLRSHRELLDLALAGGIGNMANLAALSVTSWLVVRDLGAGEAVYGLVLTVEALAGLTVAAAVPALARRFGELQIIGASFALEGVGYVVAALAGSVPVAFIGFACVGASAMGWNIVAPTVRQRRVPAELRGRVDSVYRLFMYGASPLGAVLAAAVASAIGVRGALLVCAAGLAVTCGYVILRLAPRFEAAEWIAESEAVS